MPHLPARLIAVKVHAAPVRKLAENNSPRRFHVSSATLPHAHHKYVLEWRQGFCTGVPEIDGEHQHLFELVKALELQTVEATLNELLEYVVTHFTNEQHLMEQSGYPEFQQHVALHEQLASQVAEFLALDTSWTEDRLQRLRRFLNQWLVGHILAHDLRFGRWYLEQQRTPRAGAAPRPARTAEPAQRSWLQRLLRRG
jgi:hemerythrin